MPHSPPTPPFSLLPYYIIKIIYKCQEKVKTMWPKLWNKALRCICKSWWLSSIYFPSNYPMLICFYPNHDKLLKCCELPSLKLYIWFCKMKLHSPCWAENVFSITRFNYVWHFKPLESSYFNFLSVWTRLRLRTIISQFLMSTSAVETLAHLYLLKR